MFVFGAYAYTQSRRVLAAFSYDEVMACLRIMHLHAKHKKKGYYVGYLTYECALLIQDSYYQIHSKERSSAPLLYFELFTKRTRFTPKNHTSKKPLQKPLALQKPLDAMRYKQDFKAIKTAIQAGHTYQVNYTQELELTSLLDSFTLFEVLCQRQSTPYQAYIVNPYTKILSFSPELFFHFTKHTITTQPMKGTMKRATKDSKHSLQHNLPTQWQLYKQYKKIPKLPNINTTRDYQHYKALYLDSKNRSENVMIVDLLRNDLSRIARQGSVCVKELFAIKSYPTLHQMVSTIQAKLPRHYGIIEILRALFPCGSITGAPKYKTTQIISALEQRKRGVYCGAIGVISAKECVMSVPIRTLSQHANESYYRYGVGSGVVWDSDCTQEFDELNLKCRFLFE